MTLNRIRTVHEYDGYLILTIEYFLDGRGQEICRENFHLPKWVVWKCRLKGDTSKWLQIEPIKDRRKKILETVYQNMLTLERYGVNDE